MLHKTIAAWVAAAPAAAEPHLLEPILIGRRLKRIPLPEVRQMLAQTLIEHPEYLVQAAQQDVMARHSEWIQVLTRNKYGELSAHEFLFRNLEIPSKNYLVKPVIRALALSERMALLFYDPEHIPPLIAYLRLTLGHYFAGDHISKAPYGYDYEWQLKIENVRGEIEVIPFKLGLVLNRFVIEEAVENQGWN